MDITLIIKSIAGLVVILGILMFMLLYKPKDKTAKKVKKTDTNSKKKFRTKNDVVDLQTLREIIKSKKSTTKDLEAAIDGVLKNYATIPAKLGTRTHPDFDIYNEMLFMLSKHKNANKNIILKFNRTLEKQNPQYKNEINDAVSRGLNARV
jgi:hypothetical protein